uniref:Uncharacterized protein n=1 Tax=Anguilla anguilla TaxID=7936 RepID=A0A0E9UA79_ANGAN
MTVTICIDIIKVCKLYIVEPTLPNQECQTSVQKVHCVCRYLWLSFNQQALKH